MIETKSRPGGGGLPDNFAGQEFTAPLLAASNVGQVDCACGMVVTTGQEGHERCAERSADAFAMVPGTMGTPQPSQLSKVENSTPGNLPTESPTLRAALSYAACGIHVLPVRVSLADNGKKTMQPVASWREASTTSEQTIRGWFGPGGAWASAALAIDCGKSKLVVIDPDEGKDDKGNTKEGMHNWAQLVDEHGLPATWRARTPGGGEHWFYRENPRRPIGNDATGKVAKHVDVRGLGGYVIAAPSRHEGGAWRWAEGEPEWDNLPTVPDLVADRMNRKDPEPTPAPEVPRQASSPPYGLLGGSYPQDGERRFTRQEANEFCRPAWKALETAHDGSINDRLNDAAKVMSHFNGVFWSEQEAEGTLLGFLRSTAYDAKTWKAEDTIRSAFRSAAGDWKAVPRVERAGTGQPGQVPGQPDPQRVNTLRERMRARLHTRDSLDTIEPPTPLIEGVLDKGTIALLSGKFGTYKTFVSLAWACSVATGTAWEGLPVITSGPVLYVAAEGCSGLRSRVRAWEIGQYQGRRIPADRLAVFNGRVKLTDPDEMAVLGEFVTELRPVLVVIDTLHQCAPGMEENSSKDMGTVLAAVAELRERYGVTVLLNHHTGHQGERARGSSALEDDVDTSWVLNLADTESRAAENQRTLKHRKAKDRELLADRPILLRTVEETGSAYVQSGAVTPLLEDGYAALTVMRRLDDLEVPVSAGRDACRNALTAAGHQVPRNEVLADAVRRRKDAARLGQVSGQAGQE